MKISIVTNATKAKLVNPTLEEKKLVTQLLSYYVFGYQNIPAYKNKSWDGKSTLFDWNTNSFPNGFLSLIGANFKARGYQVAILRKSLPTGLGSLPRAIGKYRKTEKYDFQWQLPDILLKKGMMTARLATGAGKTVAAALAYVTIGRPTLIITKRQALMYQFWDNLKEMDIEAGIVGDNRFSINPDLTIGMAQTLSKKIEEDSPLGEATREYLKTIEFIIGEEAHEISDSSYWNVIQHCPNAHYKLGLTATPFMKDKSESNMKLLGAFGPVEMEIDEKTLIDRGINAKPIIKYAEYKYEGKMRFSSNYHKAIHEGIVDCKAKNDIILDNVKKAITKKLPVLVLVNRQEHGKILARLFKKEKIRTVFIYGETQSERRKIALQALAQHRIDCLIGSTILDVGVDVPAIGLVIIAGGGKGEVAYRQRIGRGLRAKSKGPNVCFFLDFADEHNLHLYDHYKERKQIVMNTPGFKEGLIDGNTEFPWGMF